MAHTHNNIHGAAAGAKKASSTKRVSNIARKKALTELGHLIRLKMRT
jgi:hypothetical protein